MSPPQTDDRANEIADLLVRVYEIHEAIISTTGGLPGLRDGASLHAAVARPFATFAGSELYKTDFEKAAALFHSLIKSHPFMDGTKRTAFTAALYLLERLGYSLPLHFPVDKVVEFCVEIAEENMMLASGSLRVPHSIAEIAEWFSTLLKTSSI